MDQKLQPLYQWAEVDIFLRKKIVFSWTDLSYKFSTPRDFAFHFGLDFSYNKYSSAAWALSTKNK
jgi:hypothetical protein